MTPIVTENTPAVRYHRQLPAAHCVLRSSANYAKTSSAAVWRKADLGTALASWLFPSVTPLGPGSFAGRPIYWCQQTLAKLWTNPRTAKGVCCQ